MLHICNECNYKKECSQFLKDPIGLFCVSNNPTIKREQEERVEKSNYFGTWVPM